MESIIVGIGAFSLLIKVGMHNYLDRRHDRFEGPYPASMHPIEFAFPYIRSVKDKFLSAKRICNISYIIMVTSIILYFVIRLIKDN